MFDGYLFTINYILMRKLTLTCITCCTIFIASFAQQPATDAQVIQQSFEKLQQQKEASLAKNVPFQNIGPSVMSGRVVDIDVNPDKTTQFLVAYASGGLWYTNNNGTSFEPIMDTAAMINIGDIAVDWKNKTIWVGTGENNASRSSYAGIGMLKSTDFGKTWENIGLHQTHHIGRIVINPNNPDEVIVGAMGHLYSENKERGIYKTTDGGKTWKQTLFVNPSTGIIDVAFEPNNFSTLYASAWDKERKAWDFRGDGIGSGIYKSTDAGITWQKVSGAGSGFPDGKGTGRIGLAVFDQHTIYAVLDNQNHREKKKDEQKTKGLTKKDFVTMNAATFLELEDKKLNQYLKTNGFQEKYRAENVKQLVRSGTIQPKDLAKYLENANSQLVDTPVIGAEVYRSNDGGKTWAKMNSEYLDDIYFSYGYYFGQIQVNPKNKDHVYISGVPILKSTDAGATFESIQRPNVHADHHSLWIDPNDPNHLINGNDGGVNISYDNGAHWIKANQPIVGQFYAINIDHQTPYNVYGGLQDNGVWMGPINAKEDEAWEDTGHYPWKKIMGGDGMQVQIDSRNPNIVYTGYQFGNYHRLNLATGEMTYIQPKHELGEAPYRFNWQTPILLSSHNQDILYIGGNKLMRSMNQGTDWTAISGDLTQGGKKGNVAYGTLTSIDESTLQFGLLYVGSDDGLVHVSKNSGASWDLISQNFPKDLWVSRVTASKHKKERVYVSLNGYRWDDFTPYVFYSDDFGQHWTAISNGLPFSPVNVIKEDAVNENVLYLGTDQGAYVSMDRGKSWQPFVKGLPPVAVHDLIVQPETNDLLLGTHGRSIYKTNVTSIQHLDDTILQKSLHAFEPKRIKYSSHWGETWSKWLVAESPKINIPYFSKNATNITIRLQMDNGKELHRWEHKAEKGLNYADYDLSLTEKGRKELLKAFPDEDIPKKKNGNYYLPVGSYTLNFSNGADQSEVNLIVE